MRAQLLGELHGALPVAGLPHHLVALLGEHLDQIEPDQRLVLRDHHPPGEAPPSRSAVDPGRRVLHSESLPALT